MSAALVARSFSATREEVTPRGGLFGQGLRAFQSGYDLLSDAIGLSLTEMALSLRPQPAFALARKPTPATRRVMTLEA